MSLPSPPRLFRRIKFLLERLVVRGPLYRLLLVALLVAAISLLGGLFVHVAGAAFPHAGDAVWWAFLRLTDPGYLGDDQGVLRRTVSTVLTVLGYVLFLGALVAIMIQWFNARLHELELGLTPIAHNDHILVLGWTDRTPVIMRELLRADDRVRRFLLRPKKRRRTVRRVRVAALVDELDAELVRDLRDRVGRAWKSRRIILRSGTPLRLEHLRRVDFARASAILVPASVFGTGADATDTRTIKVLLSIAQSAPDDPDTPFPFVVAELLDPRRLPAAYGAYGAPMEAISSDLVIGRMLAQALRHPHLSYVFDEMLQQGEGNELHIADPDVLVGRHVHQLRHAFPRAIVLGLVRPAARGFEPLLDPAEDRVIREGDRLVLLATDSEDTAPSELPAQTPASSHDTSAVSSREDTNHGLPPQRRILLLGWSHRIPAFLEELDDFTRERFRVDIAAQVDLTQRRESLEGRAPRSGRVEVHQWETDYTVPAELAALQPARYDNIVIIASDWLPSGEEADARAIVGHVLVHQTLARSNADPRPHVLVELTDPANRHLVAPAADEVIVSPLVVSHMLAQIALRRELRAVFDELFGSGGAEIFLRPASDYHVDGRAVGFPELQQAAADRDEVALGLRLAHDGGALHLNPHRDASWTLHPDDEVIVLSQY